MNIAGVIAEYNPFHNGHKYQLEQIRTLTGCDGICVAMSGDFVQRGIPAIVDKYTRTRMALENGADLILELPCANVLASAEFFAAGGVHTLANIGINTLCFGTETTQADDIIAIADLQNNNRARMDGLIREYVAEGLSYAAAVEKATLLLGADNINIDILRQPNNILALEYIKAIRGFGYDIQPLAITRQGDGYNDTTVSHNRYASATALRSLILSGDDISDYVPENCGRELPYTMTLDDFTNFFNGVMYNSIRSNTDLTLHPSISRDLANKLLRTFDGKMTLTELIDRLKSKDMSYLRISRGLCQIMLGITQVSKTPEYIRVLGFNKTGAAILKHAKSVSNIPVITKCADYASLIQSDILAGDIYNSCVYTKNKVLIDNDYKHSLIIM